MRANRPSSCFTFLPALLLLATTLTAQAERPPAGGADPGGANAESQADATQPSSTLLVLLKARRVTTERAAQLITALSTRATRDRLEAARTVRDHYLRGDKACRKLADKALLRVSRQAARAQRSTLGRGGDKKVEALREASLAVSRRSDLTKEQIRKQVDPRLEQLEELLFPSFAAVLDTDAKLDAQLTAMRSAHAEQRRWFAIYRDALAGLDGSDRFDKHIARYPVPAEPASPQEVDDAIETASLRGLAMSENDRKALLHNEALRSSSRAQEFFGTARLNHIRYALGLGLVRIDPKLGDAARDHSRDMHRLRFFSHTSPVKGKERFGQRASNFGTSASAENIAAGQETGKGAIRAWWYSPGHHRNMLGNRHRRTGLGQHANKWTQLFGG